MSKPAIALYLGETYASSGLFDMADNAKPELIFEKSVFLPQTSLKSLISQIKTKTLEKFEEAHTPISVFIVTKYFDRLKQFRLGGSISQVIMKGFENSYSLQDSSALSLAAAQLIIALEANDLNRAILEKELERIKKINPDLNKVVISLPENHFSSAQIAEVITFFQEAGLKIFHCKQPYNQNELRKTLLNAGCEGTKEEIAKEILENFGPETNLYFYCKNGFEKNFENAELFNSANNFFAHYLNKNNLNDCAYFDIESFKFLQKNLNSKWLSPWGPIPIEFYEQIDLQIHPLAELKLDNLSMLSFDKVAGQLEPGPVLAGRAIKPLLLDLFWDELQENNLCKSLFSGLAQENLKSKIVNLFSVLEKSQKSNSLFATIDDLKSVIKSTLIDEVQLHSNEKKCQLIGPLASLFSEKPKDEFSWPQEIASAVPKELL